MAFEKSFMYGLIIDLYNTLGYETDNHANA